MLPSSYLPTNRTFAGIEYLENIIAANKISFYIRPLYNTFKGKYFFRPIFATFSGTPRCYILNQYFFSFHILRKVIFYILNRYLIFNQYLNFYILWLLCIFNRVFFYLAFFLHLASKFKYSSPTDQKKRIFNYKHDKYYILVLFKFIVI